jgi:hypothetical protein
MALDMWLRILMLFGIAVLVAYPFWRSTKKPPKNDANNFESEHGQPINYNSGDSHHGGGDAGGHH